jgi:iron(III) transport system substrate-binding protein
MRSRGSRLVVGLMALLALVGTACGDDAESNEGTDQGALTVYSGRDEEFIGPLLAQFEQDTGIQVDVRYGDSAELASTILEEGESSPADVFISQDAGSLGAVAEEDLFAPLPEETTGRVDDRFRSPDGLWVGISGRARVAAYNTEQVDADELPSSITGFTDPQWKGRIGFPPTNSSFQAFVAAMIITEGEEATRQFLEGLVANDPLLLEGNSEVLRAVASEEIDVGFVNHYYRYEVAAEDGEIPVENHFFAGGDPGALVNTAGAAILASTDQPDDAERLIDYLTSDPGQRYFAEETFEYPVVAGFEPSVDLVPLDEIDSPDIDLSDLGGTLEPALQLLADVGLV